MLKKFLFLILTIPGGQSLFAQIDSSSASVSSNSKRLKHYVHVGYNFGGLAPIPLPNTIRKIDSYSPGFSPSLSYEVVYPLSKTLGIGAALRFDIKGMNITDSVQYFHTLVTMDNSEFEGDFTGTNKTVDKNMYLSLPINVVYSARGNWRFKLGFYTAYLIRPSFSGQVSNGYIRKGNSLGEKVAIDTATFNFDDVQRKFDWGLQAGAEKRFLKRYAVTGDLQWGLRPVFPPSFKGIGYKMTNIFFTLGVRMQLFE
ncbi:outer membrane beta-barrel protein [Pedobacter sp. HMF7647]|uniref:Outer membrane beta-barrel protein n=1 Tax=Hufsiella arboris TaxID=2695275 RepID=A0A7K1YE72_9SPHI|nr:porin family protein [Hufsiella arboris]MXV52885.1 outer membrane beta-barrel protein [Hufsiella arboris]